jgi:CheY-like chemotaxis protein
MPELSGIEVAKRIRGFEIQRGVPATEHVPIVIATGLEDDRYFLAAHEAGSSWYLRKPVERAALEALMGDLGIQPIASSR